MHIDKMSHVQREFSSSSSSYLFTFPSLDEKFLHSIQIGSEPKGSTMPACPRDNDYSSLAPPGFTQDDSALKRVQLVELLQKLIEKCHREPEFIDEQSKQTALLIATAQYALLPTSNPTDEKREFVQRMIALGQELWAHESQNDDREERSAPIHSSKDLFDGHRPF